MLLHFPTLLLLIGLPVFWLELYVFHGRQGHATPTASILFLLTVIFLIWRDRDTWREGFAQLKKEAQQLPLFQKGVFGLGAIGVLVLAGIALAAHLLPPHLLAEYDAINYHYALPRQHLILHSFAHLPWSTADLWFFPLQFGLAPYWFVTALPNKTPQFLFLLGIWGLAFRLAYRLTSDPTKKFAAGTIALLAVAGSHGFGVQYGLAMLDLSIAYLLIAAIDSFIGGRYWLAGIEMAFYLWAKSFLPVQMTMVLIAVIVLVRAMTKNGWGVSWTIAPGERLVSQGWIRTTLYAALFSVFVGFPFMIKSLYYAGTPAYPAKVGLVAIRAPETAHRQSALEERAGQMMEDAKSGGVPRTFTGFATHFWKLAVPTSAVNNEFDYPAGLPYLLFLVPFFVALVQSLREKRLPLFAVLIVLLWGFWWISAQHTRFLYAPFVMLFVGLASWDAVQTSKVLALGLLLSVTLTTVSVFRQHQPDFGQTRWNVLREKDKELIQLGQTIGDTRFPVLIPEQEVTYATFPVLITLGNTFILE